MKKIVLLLFLTSSFYACKSDKKNDTENVKKPEEIIKVKEYPNFTVNIVAKVLEDDRFRLLFTEELGENFSSKKLLFKKVVGSNEFQTITFELKKEDIYPVSLRINVGENINQKPIIIDKIEIFHDENSILIEGNKFSQYFFPNKYIELNDEGIINFRNTDEKRFPFFVSKGLLQDELSKL